jgi:predicted RNase H-like nuclease (RuvC/YqgF family)
MDSLMTFMVGQITKLEQQLAKAHEQISYFKQLEQPTVDEQREIRMAKRIEEQCWVISQLKKQIQEKKVDQLRERPDVACLQSQIAKNENILDKYEKQIENLEKQLAESKKSAYIYSDENLDRLDSIIETQNTKIEQLQDQVKDYRCVITELEGYLEEAHMENENLEDRVKEYDSQADFENNQIVNLESQIDNQRTIIDKLEDTIEKKENSISSLESKLEKQDTEIKQKTYHILELQAHIQDGTTLEKLLSETFVAQYKNGSRLAFIYGQLEITGHFRDVEKIDLANSKDWRMSFRISANSAKENLLMPYNNQLDDINFSKAVKLIKDAATTMSLYVGDYSPEWIEVILNNSLMSDHPLIRDCYLDVVTRHYVDRFRGVENLYTWHQIGKFKFAIPRECEWDTKDIVKMFKHHIKN